MEPKSIFKVEEFGAEYYLTEKALMNYLSHILMILDWEGCKLYRGIDPEICIKKMSEQAYGNRFIITSGIEEVPRRIRITRLPFYPEWEL